MSVKEKISQGIDGIVGFFSPKAGFKRRMYREAIKLTEQFGSYRGADRSRLRGSWMPGGGSADEDIIPDLPAIRERSRDLNRNDAHASGITNTMTTNVVGTGIRPQSRIEREVLGISDRKADKFQKQAERVWKQWLPIADAGRRMDFYEIQQLVDRQILENGEAIIIPVMLKDRPFSLALQVIESDRLATPPEHSGNKSVRGGIRLGENGEPISYFIQDPPR